MNENSHAKMPTLAIMACAVLLVHGCCGCGKKDKTVLCEAALAGQTGKHFSVGTNDSEAEARKSAVWGSCYQYCNYESPIIEKAWMEWKQTEAGQKSKLGRSGEIDIHLDAERDSCTDSCAASAAGGGFTVDVQCSPPSKYGTCTASLAYGGGTWTATEDGPHPEYHSRRVACRNYCKEGDADIQKTYDEWAASPEGKDSNWSSRDMALEHVDPLFDAVNLCQSDCIVDIMEGKATVAYDCR